MGHPSLSGGLPAWVPASLGDFPGGNEGPQNGLRAPEKSFICPQEGFLGELKLQVLLSAAGIAPPQRGHAVLPPEVLTGDF